MQMAIKGRRGLCAGLLLAAAFSAPVVAASERVLPGGCVQVVDKDNHPVGQCPLEHTDVNVEISGFIARVTLTQRFGNPFTEPIEAIYTFPMSERAAVDTMLMKIGDRTIRGLIKERGEAQRIYREARDAGKAASLLDQERPNIFTQSVANILPGNNIEITISYVEYLKYEDGRYEFSFPMVVGPRYIPGNPVETESPRPKDPRVVPGLKPGPDSTDQVPDSGRITPPITPEGIRAGHDISLAVTIDAGMPLQEVRSLLHEVDVQTEGNVSRVSLKQKNEIPNRDFVLTYTVSGPSIEDAVLTHAGAKGGFFSLILQPPARVNANQITPKEMIFVIDKSGSMSGFPIEKAKATMKQCIEGMNPADTFNLVSFSGGLGYCFEGSVPNTPENRKKALEYLSNLEGGGGTEMMSAIMAALGGPGDNERLRIVCFMTDGFIGNDMAIIDAVQKNAKHACVFAFGIGNSVNRFLIEGMARAGRGAAEVITLESEGDEAAERFHERVQNPILTDITVDFGGLEVAEVFPDPGAIPDVFSSTPLVLTGRYSRGGTGTITVRGNTAAGPFERSIDVTLPETEPEHDVLAALWARRRIEWLMDQDWLGMQRGTPNKDIASDITKLGLEFGLLTQYTSFVAVEERVVTKGGKPTIVEVPLEMPDGVSYEGIFGDAGNLQALGYAGAPVAAVRRAAPDARMNKAVPMPSRTAPAPAIAHTEAEAVAPMKDESKVETASKIDSALQGLAARVVKGAYSEGRVKVVDGMVRVQVKLTAMTDDAIAAVKKLGARIVSERRSNKMLLVSIKVEDLEKLAALDVVDRVEPTGN